MMTENPYQTPQATLEGDPEAAAEKRKYAEFPFRVDGADVIAQGYFMNGRERILVDGKVISDRRSFAFRTGNSFQLHGREYRIRFIVRNGFRVRLFCELWCGEELLQKYCCEIRFNYWYLPAMIIPAFAIGILGGLLKEWYQLGSVLDVLMPVLMFAVLILVGRLFAGSRQVSIVRVFPPQEPLAEQA